MHTRDEKIGKRAARRDRRGPENYTCGRGRKSAVTDDAVIWCQVKTSGVCPTKWVNCVTCVGQSPAWHIKPRWSRYHYCDLRARAAFSAQDFRREFSHALPVSAVDGRIHGQRERDMAVGGGLQRQSVIAEYCGWADRDKCWSRHAVACSV